VSTGMVDFVVRVDKKLWFGSGLFKNWHSIFSTLGAVFGDKCFDHTCGPGIALPDDVAGFASSLVDWGRICIMELCCKVFGVHVVQCFASPVHLWPELL